MDQHQFRATSGTQPDCWRCGLPEQSSVHSNEAKPSQLNRLSGKDTPVESRLTAEPTEFQKINAEWVEICEAAIKKCPIDFLGPFNEVMFAGQHLITEARITAQINGARETLDRR